MIAAHAIISGFIDEPMRMHMCICRGVYASLMSCWFHGNLDVSGASRVSLLVLLVRDARHDAFARPPAAVAVV